VAALEEPGRALAGGQGAVGGSRRSRSGSTPSEEQRSYPGSAVPLPLLGAAAGARSRWRLGRRQQIRRRGPPPAADLRRRRRIQPSAVRMGSAGPWVGSRGLSTVFSFFLFILLTEAGIKLPRKRSH
jgi:hypothetical protein